MVFKVNVIGAGVNGLASALSIANLYPDCYITITSADYCPHTTSNHGFGMVIMLPSDDEDLDQIGLHLIKQTFNYCRQEVGKFPEKTGVLLQPTIAIIANRTPKDKRSVKYLHETGFGVKQAETKEIDNLGLNLDAIARLYEDNLSKDDLAVYTGQHYIIDTGRYLLFLMQRLSSLRSKKGEQRVNFVRKHLSCLNDLGPCDLIVNCSGSGAGRLVDDSDMTPIRGQYLSVVAPDQKKLIFVNDNYATCIVPRLTDVAVGGTHQYGRSSSLPDPDDTEGILRRAEAIFPGIRQTKLRKIDVGIRPGRIGGPRVELEMRRLSRNKVVPVIHNYGHGSFGISQHYGCAVKVGFLAGPYLQTKSML